jgi:iron complex outermembrane receptor protein
MRIKINATLAIAVSSFSAILFLSPGSTYAQDTDESRDLGASLFDEITVTARRREETLYETPAAVTAMNGEAMTSLNISNLDDVGKYVPNLTIARYGVGNTAHASVFIRGIGLQDHIIVTDPGVGVYLDGVYLGRQMGSNLSLNNIERVEVLRGPQGTLYGRNTIGGAVNIITRRPGAEEVFEIGLKAGSRGRIGVDAYANFALADNFALAFSGDFTRRNGVGHALMIDNPEAEIGEELVFNGRVTADWAVNDRFSLLFSIDGMEAQNGQSPYMIEFNPLTPTPPIEAPGGCCNGDFGHLDPSLVAPDPDDSFSTVAGLESTSNRSLGGSITAEFEISDELDAKILLSSRSSEYSGGLDDDDSTLNLSEFPETGEADQTSLELQLNGEYGNMNFVGGLYYFEEEGETDSGPWVFSPFNTPGALDNFGNPTCCGGDFGWFNLQQEATSVAGYANVSFDVSDRLTIGAGARYTEDEKDASAIFPTFAERKFLSNEWDAFTWDLNLSYELRDSLNAYAQIQKGYQTGGYPPRPFGGPDQFEPYNESETLNFEVGLKGAITESFTLLAAAFFTQYDDLALPFSDTLAGGGFVTIVANAGESESKGIELEGVFSPTDNFNINFSIGWLDAEITEVAPGTIGVAEGDSPALTPDLTYSITPQWNFLLDGGGTVRAQVDYSYRDEIFGQSVENLAEKMDSRGLLGFSVDYVSSDQSWTLGVYGENVTDEVYDQGRFAQNGFVGIVLSNDRSEFGVRLLKRFTGF